MEIEKREKSADVPVYEIENLILVYKQKKINVILLIKVFGMLHYLI